MNVYQKAAIFILRLTGFVVALVGALGPIGLLAVSVAGGGTSSYPAARWVGSAMWFVGGVVLVLMAKTIGRLLGRGLD
jgi:hypothetical protein